MRLFVALACLLPCDVLALTTKTIGDADLPLTTAAQGKYNVVFSSSPTRKEVSYAILEDQVLVGKVHPLVQSGLEGPLGIAVDADGGALFVTDRLAKKIYRYPLGAQACNADTCASPYLVKVSGTRVEVLEKVESQWVALDSAGNLYYTDEAAGAQSVNMLSHSLIEQIVRGVKSSSSVSKTSEEDGVSLAKAESSQHLRHASGSHHSADPTGILTLYETGVDDHVTIPEGLAVSGDHVFWSNHRELSSEATSDSDATNETGSSISSSLSSDGSSVLSLLSTSAGSVGEVARGWTSFTKEVEDKKDKESTIVVSTEVAPKGLTKSTNMLFFTADKNSLYAVTAAGQAVELTDTFQKPRGLVWDGIGSLFIADQGLGAIYTVPSGEAKEKRRVKKIFDSEGAFGVAVVAPTASNHKSSGHSSGSGTSSTDCLIPIFCYWP